MVDFVMKISLEKTGMCSEFESFDYLCFFNESFALDTHEPISSSLKRMIDSPNLNSLIPV